MSLSSEVYNAGWGNNTYDKPRKKDGGERTYTFTGLLCILWSGTTPILSTKYEGWILWLLEQQYKDEKKKARRSIEKIESIS